MKTNITALLNRQRTDKQGKQALRIRTTINKKVQYYSTGITLTPDQFKDGEIIHHTQKVLLNVLLRKKIAEIEKELLESEIMGESVLQVKKYKNIKLTDYAAKKIDQWAATQSKATIRHKKSYLNKIDQFNPRIKLTDVNADFLTKLEGYCKSIGNSQNTIWSCTKFLKTIIHAAIEDGAIVNDPLPKFSGTKYVDPFRETLSAQELDQLEAFAVNPLQSEKLVNAANWFLFSCYTGLRYGDLSNFVGLNNGKVLLKTQKTGEVISIFATRQIIAVKDRITRAVISNQKANDYIKIIMAAIGVDKKISFHNARHTFAVEFLNRGGRIEILSKLLGHSSLKTTQIYAKISTKLADAEMQKVWG